METDSIRGLLCLFVYKPASLNTTKIGDLFETLAKDPSKRLSFLSISPAFKRDCLPKVSLLKALGAGPFGSGGVSVY